MRLIDFVNKFPDKDWNWNYLSCNPSITFDHVLDYPHKPWNWRGLSRKVIKFPHARIDFLGILSKI
jgi:hypothetical protein